MKLHKKRIAFDDEEDQWRKESRENSQDMQQKRIAAIIWRRNRQRSIGDGRIHGCLDRAGCAKNWAEDYSASGAFSASLDFGLFRKASLRRASAVFSVRGVQDIVGDAQAFYRFAIHNVRFDDFVDVVGAHAAIKNAFRIDSDSRAELALIKAAGLIGAHELDTAPRKFHFEETLQFALSSGIAATARVTGLTLIHANKNVFPELCHLAFRYLQDTRNTRCDANRAAP
jgi:hypothetical protein